MVDREVNNEIERIFEERDKVDDDPEAMAHL